MRFSLARKDNGVSDIVGTAVLLGVTVVIVAASTLTFANSLGTTTQIPRLDIKANATASAAGIITIQHAGGNGFAASDIEVVVSNATWAERYSPALGTFSLGAKGLQVALPRALVEGDSLDVLVYAKGIGTPLATATVGVTGPSGVGGAPSVFSLLVSDPPPGGGVVSATAGGAFRLSVVATHSAGRKAIASITADLSSVNGSRAAPLFDDGTHGDARAGDGNFSGFLPIPSDAPQGFASIVIRAMDLDGYLAPAPQALTIEVLPPLDLSSVRDLLAQFNNSSTSAFNDQSSTTVGLTGPQGLPGQNGSVSGLNASLGPAPQLSAISPTWGVPGTVVTLTGSNLDAISAVLLAEVGSTTAYNVPFSVGSGAVVGTEIIFAAPYIPERDYAVNVTRVDGAWATAPQVFSVTSRAPRIDLVTPASARAYEQVSVFGANLTGISSVTLQNASLGSFAVPWAFVDDSTIAFVTHPGLAPGLYDVNVSNGLKWAVKSWGFESLLPLAPEGLAISPSSGLAGSVVTLTGTNLNTISRIVLNQTNGTQLIAAGWYFDGDAITIVIPDEAAPPGPWSVPYAVDLQGSFVGSVTVPTPLTVLPTGLPTITSFTPNKGVPFTQVRIYGSNFINVRDVSFGATAVYFTVASSNEIVAVTHAGLAAGNYSIKVSTGTGVVATTVGGAGLFTALPAVQQPVYPEGIVGNFGIYIEKAPNNALWSFTKFQLKNSWTVASPPSLIYDPYQNPPDDGVQVLTQVCKNATTSTYVYRFALGNHTPFKYSSIANVFDFHYALPLTHPTLGAATVAVYANTQNLEFHLGPTDPYLAVYDHGTYPTSKDFQGCNTP